jgi:hypothetical protein
MFWQKKRSWHGFGINRRCQLPQASFDMKTITAAGQAGAYVGWD